MARFVDLELEEDAPPDTATTTGAAAAHRYLATDGARPGAAGTATDDAAARPDPDRNAVTRALGSYPIIIEIAGRLDLNSLDSLSRTCRQVHAGLLQYRAALIARSLRCVNEGFSRDPSWKPAGTYHGRCARDLVGECRRCGVVVCRNCIMKQPLPKQLRGRHRRLCETCVRAPLARLCRPLGLPAGSPPSDFLTRCCTCDEDVARRMARAMAPSQPELDSTPGVSADSGVVWLCWNCGRGLRSADDQYAQLWRWRQQYGTVSSGGLGTGAGGDRGLECGRQSWCLAAELVLPSASAQQQHQILQLEHRRLFQLPDGGDAKDSPSLRWPARAGGGLNDGFSDFRPRRVGAPVVEWDAVVEPSSQQDQNRRQSQQRQSPSLGQINIDPGPPLAREANGTVRSWCGWCARVIPSDADWELVCQEWNDRRHAEGSLGGLTAGNGKELVGLEIADPTTATADKGVKS